MAEKRPSDGSISPGQSRVKMLLERFEKSEVVVAEESNSLLTARDRGKPIPRHRFSKQQAFTGIHQKRSILKRQSKSHTDIRPSGGSVTGRGRGVMAKTNSHEDQANFIDAIRMH
ncbi:unnamed protein product [Litomosoides sigmodontis]|uniref:Uncharacterized protein n=1 Tax=Litomosoides sigmodontis TaxID=42156 RepID=A0A3P6URE6_LITSI|nr:unnamed protein product [Litomosoides sigmodontis]